MGRCMFFDWEDRPIQDRHTTPIDTLLFTRSCSFRGASSAAEGVIEYKSPPSSLHLCWIAEDAADGSAQEARVVIFIVCRMSKSFGVGENKKRIIRPVLFYNMSATYRWDHYYTMNTINSTRAIIDVSLHTFVQRWIASHLSTTQLHLSKLPAGQEETAPITFTWTAPVDTTTDFKKSYKELL